MAQSLSKILLHIVFSTKNREKLIPREGENRLHRYLAATCRILNAEAFRVGGTRDHVHIACCLPRTISVSKLLEEIKSSSSKWIKQEFKKCSSFGWQSGYAVFSLGHSQLVHLLKYIDNQKEHHRKISYREEVLQFLKKYNVEYDEQYLWD